MTKQQIYRELGISTTFMKNMLKKKVVSLQVTGYSSDTIEITKNGDCNLWDEIVNRLNKSIAELEAQLKKEL